jgi:serine/threonine protein kinase
VWALGVVLYEMLTFQRPFQAETVAALVQRIQSGEVDTERLQESGHPPLLTVLATPLYLLNAKPEARLTLPALMQYLMEHASSTGLTAPQLEEEHQDCRNAVSPCIEKFRQKLHEAKEKQLAQQKAAADQQAAAIEAAAKAAAEHEATKQSRRPSDLDDLPQAHLKKRSSREDSDSDIFNRTM